MTDDPAFILTFYFIGLAVTSIAAGYYLSRLLIFLYIYLTASICYWYVRVYIIPNSIEPKYRESKYWQLKLFPKIVFNFRYNLYLINKVVTLRPSGIVIDATRWWPKVIHPVEGSEEEDW